MHALPVKGRLLYTHDETIADLCGHLREIGGRRPEDSAAARGARRMARVMTHRSHQSNAVRLKTGSAFARITANLSTMIACGIRSRSFRNGNPRHASDEETGTLAKAERLMPDLLSAMREDLASRPLVREFVILKRDGSTTAVARSLLTITRDHQDLDEKLQILANLGLIREITYNNVDRYLISEFFAEYLETNNSGQAAA